MKGKQGRRPLYTAEQASLVIAYSEKIVHILASKNELLVSLELKTKRELAVSFCLANLAEIRRLLADYQLQSPLEDLIKYAGARLFSRKSPLIPHAVLVALPWAEQSVHALEMTGLPDPSGLDAKKLKPWLQQWLPKKEPSKAQIPKMNFLNSNYVQSDANAVWCVDTTERGGLFVTIVLDIASRFVVGSLLELSDPTSESLTAFMKSLFIKVGYKPKKWHSDRGSAFASNAFQDLLTSEGVICSFDTRHKYSFGNQVIESFNSRIWQFLDLQSGNREAIQEFARKSASDRMFLLKAVVEWYNYKTYTGNKNHTAGELYDALIKAPFSLEIATVPETVEAEIVGEYHELAIAIARGRKELITLQEIGHTHANEFSSIFYNLVPDKFVNLQELKEARSRLEKMFYVFADSVNALTRGVQTVMENQDQLITVK